MSNLRPASLIVNCGYARVSIYQNSNPGCTGRSARQNIDTEKRLASFRSQFSTHASFGIPDGYFELTGKDNSSQFDRESTRILNGFRLKFRSDTPGSSRESYLHEFSLMKWIQLPDTEKAQHTLRSCVRCYETHEHHQTSFPLRPVFQPKPVVVVDQEALQRQGVKIFTTNVFSELNRVFTNEASSSFTDALLQDKSLPVERKKPALRKGGRKREYRKKLPPK